MKKIYFACSIRGGREEVDTYKALVEYLKTKCIVLSELFADDKLTSIGIQKPSYEIWKTDTDWIEESDAVIAEVTQPSLGVGYEIAYAEQLKKPVLALFRVREGKKLSAMIDGSPATNTEYYTSLDAAKQAINNFLATL